MILRKQDNEQFGFVAEGEHLFLLAECRDGYMEYQIAITPSGELEVINKSHMENNAAMNLTEEYNGIPLFEAWKLRAWKATHDKEEFRPEDGAPPTAEEATQEKQ